MKTTVYADALAAASLARAKDKLRPMLTGIHIVDNGSYVWVVATDSYRLVRVSHPSLEKPEHTFSATIPADELALYIKAAGHGLLQLEIDGTACKVWACKTNKNGVPTSLVLSGIVHMLDGKYPDVCKVLEYEREAAPISALNSRYLADSCKIAQIATNEKNTTMQVFTPKAYADAPQKPTLFYSINEATHVTCENLIMSVKI